jgi:hypothetical protein
VADGVRLVLEDLARHRSAVRGQRGDERDQLERDARRALGRHRPRPLSGVTGSVGAGRGGVARYVAEPGMPEQVVPVGKPPTRGAGGSIWTTFRSLADLAAQFDWDLSGSDNPVTVTRNLV